MANKKGVKKAPAKKAVKKKTIQKKTVKKAVAKRAVKMTRTAAIKKYLETGKKRNGWTDDGGFAFISKT